MSGRVSEWLDRHRAELGLGLRITMAGLLGFAIGHLLGLAQVYWVVLTATIVTQASVGGSLKAIADRLVGTVAGAACGVVVAVSVPHSDELSTAGALAVALIPLALLVAWWPGYRIAPVTAAIVLLGPSPGANPADAALDRVLEIGIGCAIAIAVSVAATHSRAHRLLGTKAVDALIAMRDQTTMLLGGVSEPVDRAAVLALHDRIRGAIERAAALAGEAARERSSFLTDLPDPDPLVRTIRRLSHDLVMLARALPSPLPEPARQRLAEPAADVSAGIAGFLADTAGALSRRAPAPVPSLQAVSDALAGYETAMAELRRDRVIAALPAEDAERIFGAAFALQQIGRNLEELAGRAADFG